MALTNAKPPQKKINTQVATTILSALRQSGNARKRHVRVYRAATKPSQAAVVFSNWMRASWLIRIMV